MNARYFVDTNVLLYAHDVDEEAKHVSAKRVLRQLWQDGSGVLSPQVLQEFYVIATRKLATPLAKTVARAVVEKYSVWCIDTTAAEVTAALEIEAEARISFWDALIVSSARKAGAAVLLSEDMNAGQTVAGVRIENPFAGLEPRE